MTERHIYIHDYWTARIIGAANSFYTCRKGVTFCFPCEMKYPPIFVVKVILWMRFYLTLIFWTRGQKKRCSTMSFCRAYLQIRMLCRILFKNVLVHFKSGFIKSRAGRAPEIESCEITDSNSTYSFKLLLREWIALLACFCSTKKILIMQYSTRNTFQIC